MGARGSGNYATGAHALGMCERCSKKTLLRKLVYDGQFPDLLVCSECWDPKHPQEYLPEVTDPITLYDPTGDPDAPVANLQVLSWPLLKNIVNDVPMPLQIQIATMDDKYTVAGGGVVEDV